MFGAIALAQQPKVSECFKVHSMIRADADHYWTTWTNACPYTIDSVYVMVRFADRSSKDVADGVWSLHFVAPGAHRTMRFSAPGKLADFASVRPQKITADMSEAFGRDVGPVRAPMSSLELAVSAYKGAVAKEGSRGTTVTIVGDAGERAYASQPAPVSGIVTEVLANTTVARAAPSAVVGDAGEASFRNDFADPWRTVLSAQESAVSPAPRASFVRFVSEEKPLHQ